MSRKKKHPEHVNHERWLVSYADFITLLFAFFVVMFAVSQVDSNKVGRFTESVQSALEWSVFFDGAGSRSPIGSRGGMSSTGSNGPLARSGGQGFWSSAKLAESLRRRLNDAVLSQRVSVLTADRDLVVRLGDDTLFEPGSTELRPAARDEVRTVGSVLRGYPNAIRVEGHSDSTPTRSMRGGSNWELSAGRAAAVLRVLIQDVGIDARRLSMAGYADTRPIVANDTEAGRRQNRRVDLVVFDTGR